MHNFSLFKSLILEWLRYFYNELELKMLVDFNIVKLNR